MFNIDDKTELYQQHADEFQSLPRQQQRLFSVTSLAISDVPSNILIKSRIKYGTKWSVLKGVLGEYSKSTSVHGMRYIFELHRPFHERLCWLMISILSFYFAVSIMWITYLKWLESPVILGFDETLVKVNKIPFPTITICPEIKMEAETFNFTEVSQQIWWEIEDKGKFENMANLTEEQLEHFAATLQICDSDVIDRFAPHIPQNITLDVSQTLIDLAVIPNITVPYCKWNRRFYYTLLKYVITDEGVCYQFNGLQSEDIYRDQNFISYSDNTTVNYNEFLAGEPLPKFNEITGSWSLDDGYVGQGFNAYPQRSVLSSARNGLFVVMIGFDHNFEYACRRFKQGYKIFFNSPESVPSTTDNYILVSHEDEVLISIIPHYITSTEDLHDISPEKRQCFFNNERYLRFFKTYSESNCRTECLTNFTIAKCGCAKFWMPKPLDIPVCSLAQVDCYTKAIEEMNYNMALQTKQTLNGSSVKTVCNCLPSCNSLDYNFEISRAHFDLEKTMQAHRTTYDFVDARASRLSVFFKEAQFTAIKRTVMFGVPSLIAKFGGIFGLFMGVSGLSIIEFIYFFSVRLYHNLRKRRRITRILKELEMEEKEKDED